MTNVSIGGNVIDSVVVLGNDNFIVKIGDVNGGIVNIIKPSDIPKYSARSTPVTIKPRAFPSLLDRENEFELIKKSIQTSVPVSVWGQQGVGKTSFIRQLTHTLDIGDFTSGIIYLDTSGLGYEDLLQALFDSFFESDSTYKPTTTDIVRALQNIKALIFLDDIQIGRDEVPSILDAAPNSLFILSSIERSLWGEGEVIPLQGLPESESIKLFEKELSRPLSDQEKITVINICAMLHGHPLQILQAASLARDSGKPVENLLSEITNEKTDDKSVAYMAMANLSDSEKQVLALLAAAGGNIVSLEHIKGIFKEGSAQKDVQRLVALGLVQSHSPRFNITDALVSSITATWNLASWQDVLLNYTITWLSQQPASALVEESSGLLIHTLKSAGEQKKWREVIQLGRALEKFMVLFKRWQTWSDILNLILTAAKALNDSKIQAWALHQLGSRALFMGYASEAKTFLSQALNIRQAIGDKAGMAVTQHNINTLNGIVAPIKATTSGCKKYLTCGCGTAIGLTILAAIAVMAFLFWPSTPANDVPPTEPPVAITVTDTPSPFPTSTVTPTFKVTQTLIPTHTPTATPPAVLLYDFVERANEAYWYKVLRNSDGEFQYDLTFFNEPFSPNPESYLSEFGNAYAGWDFKAPLMNGKTYKQVLITYPYYENFKVFGEYGVEVAQPAPNAYLELTVGYKDIFVEPTDGVVFRIYINEKVVLESPYKPGDKPINIGKQVRISDGTSNFRLEVESNISPYDYATWAVVKLWDRKP
jgi:hypothetical protein